MMAAAATAASTSAALLLLLHVLVRRYGSLKLQMETRVVIRKEY